MTPYTRLDMVKMRLTRWHQLEQTAPSATTALGTVRADLLYLVREVEQLQAATSALRFALEEQAMWGRRPGDEGEDVNCWCQRTSCFENGKATARSCQISNQALRESRR